ncbi:hypothetical protein MJK72_01730 [Klebsiella pneumoniae]|nr:hypothetical protein MJK72_01730 [Klebsiella pneumoniae]
MRAGGPALLFENPKGYTMPVLCNSVRHAASRGVGDGAGGCQFAARGG